MWQPAASNLPQNCPGLGRQGPNQTPIQKRMEFPCPIKCSLNATHPWGSLAFCDTFKAKELPIRRDLVKKARVCVNCLKTNNHTALRPCRAQPCFNCKASHHTLLCPKGPNGHVLLAEVGIDKEDD